MVLFFCLTTLQNWQNCPAALTNHSGFLSIQLGFFRTSRGGANITGFFRKSIAGRSFLSFLFFPNIIASIKDCHRLYSRQTRIHTHDRDHNTIVHIGSHSVGGNLRSHRYSDQDEAFSRIQAIRQCLLLRKAL